MSKNKDDYFAKIMAMLDEAKKELKPLDYFGLALTLYDRWWKILISFADEQHKKGDDVTSNTAMGQMDDYLNGRNGG